VIAFTSKREGDDEIYTIRPDRSGVRRLTNSPGNDAHVSWSPGGEWIAFCERRRLQRLGAPASARWPTMVRPDGTDARPADRQTVRDRDSGVDSLNRVIEETDV
jgi:WD40-like Beta Propeller Repeat